MSQKPEALVGTLLDGWRLEALLGRGGMGAVFRARHAQKGLRAALKLLAVSTDEEREAYRRLRREVQVMGRLSHPSLATIYQEALDHDPPYFAMELLEGGDLLGRIETKALTSALVTKLAIQVAEALDALHGQKILHRDIKPSNVLFSLEGRAKLADFGLAKAEDLTSLTVDRSIRGTMAYIAPEVLRGAPESAATDLYQLGVTLYQTASGRLPYNAREVGMHASGNGPALPPLSGSGVTPRLEAAIVSLCSVDPAGRPPSAAALLDMLKATTSPRRIIQVEAVPGPAPRPRRRLWPAAGVVLAAVLAAVAWMKSESPAPAAPVAQATPLQPPPDDPLLGGVRRALGAERSLEIKDGRVLVVDAKSILRPRRLEDGINRIQGAGTLEIVRSDAFPVIPPAYQRGCGALDPELKQGWMDLKVGDQAQLLRAARKLVERDPACVEARLLVEKVVRRLCDIRKKAAKDGVMAAVSLLAISTELDDIPYSKLRDEGLQALDAAVRLSPGHDELWREYAEWMEREQDRPSELRAMRWCVLLAPETAEYWRKLADVEARDPAGGGDALAHVERAFRLYAGEIPTSAHVTRGHALVRAGRKAEARAEYRRALDADPTQRGVERALAALGQGK